MYVRAVHFLLTFSPICSHLLFFLKSVVRQRVSFRCHLIRIPGDLFHAPDLAG